MSNRSAAGLRRSAIVARIRLREEWSELKGPEEPNQKSLKQIPEIIRKTQKPVHSASKVVSQKVKYTKNVAQKSPPLKKNSKTVLRNVTNATQKGKNPISKNYNNDTIMEALRGIVALVDVGTETRALALRAALMALGATVVPAWSPLVTHLVWTQGGDRSTRAKARALACRVVSPLWVEACASCGRRVPESAFPAAARPSDLPSPRALRIMLKRAEAENIPLSEVFLSKQGEARRKDRSRLRISSEHDTSTDQADTSKDQSTDQTDTSQDTSRDTTDPEMRVNTLPRGGQCVDPPPQPKSRRKLFTQKEAEPISSADESDTPSAPKRIASAKLTQRERRDLARAERLARRLLGGATPAKTQILSQSTAAPRIVLTGMSRNERQIVKNAIKTLNGHVQKQVNHHTTHVLLGSFQSSLNQNNPDHTGINPLNQTTESHCSKTPSTNTRVPVTQIPRCEIRKARTLNALLGAARGCRVLYAQWAMDSLEVKKWLHHHGYEVAHLKNTSEIARVERSVLGRTYSEYAYDVFSGMRIRISPQTEQRDAAIELLSLCGGVVQFGDSLDGGQRAADYDLCVGNGKGEVSSKWVFDSVAAGRMRTTRRYVN